MVPDGYGPASITMTRLVSKEKTLEFDKYGIGTTRTYASDSFVTDSASSATAYSCGIKTYNLAIAVDNNKVPCRTIAEAAKAQGYKVGLVVTSYITHATPAAFSSHVEKRSMYTEIASQQITKNIDILLGGGLKHFLPKAQGGQREDGRNLLQEARDKYGYTVLSKRSELLNAKLPLLGIFQNDHLDYEIDREEFEHRQDASEAPPTLGEMAKVAVELLQEAVNQDPKCPGYFLLIEGSRIDHASHANDPGATVQEALEYDRTFKYVIDAVDRFKNTQVVSVADHACGGLSLGQYDDDTVYSWFPDVIKKQKMSVGNLLNVLQAKQMEIVPAFEKYMGIKDLSPEEIREIKDAVAKRKAYLLGRPISKRAKVYWETTGHDGVDVPHHAYGPASLEFRGNLENYDIAHKIAKYLGLRGVGEPIDIKKK